ncbi:hypothetical protein TSAR_007997 [Trichomalopsis sarcophagae]|uniref:Uncharacterized protein n=1 Tax=Trichomalopsis sarcophagae TaxID=543379 RepID=A0A232FNR2_9HYME|nr:hypothetical protein TSAR_007997 [Trichomalopsis sarcophagae]
MHSFVNFCFIKAARDGFIIITFEVVAKAKKAASPNNLIISEVKCEVSIQSLLEHTIMRLFEYLKLDFNEDANTELVLLVKYGFDGTNANRYKQKSSKAILKIIMINAMIIDMIFYIKDYSYDMIIFSEDVYFKYLYFCEEKITKLLVLVCNALNETSSQRCFLCGATILELNKIDSELKYGFSVLHARIRYMELWMNQLKVLAIPMMVTQPEHKPQEVEQTKPSTVDAKEQKISSSEDTKRVASTSEICHATEKN